MRDESAVLHSGLPSARRETGSVEAISPSEITSPQMSECSETSRRRILVSSMESALDDDNLLAEFLLRLPPLPSSLRRASLVCKRWRRLVSDPHFLRRFRSHHGKAPLLCFIYHDGNNCIRSISALDSPNKIPALNFSLRLLGQCCTILDSHHGLVLIFEPFEPYNKHVHVWDPVICDHRSVALPQAFNGMLVDGLVLCAVNDEDHVHGACHSCPFKVVLVGFTTLNELCVSVYSSETGVWGNTIRLPFVTIVFSSFRAVLIENSVLWLLSMETVKILLFDLDEQNFAYLDVPSYVCDVNAFVDDKQELSIMPMDSVDSVVMNLIVLEGFTATVRVWKLMSDDTVDATWMLGNTLELNNILSLRPSGCGMPVVMLGKDEDGNVVFKLSDGSAVMVHIETLQFKKLAEKFEKFRRIGLHPFTSFYTPGI